ncbi:MAG: hypothetical protein AAFY22_12125 [Pseudomonadota bacterium]
MVTFTSFVNEFLAAAAYKRYQIGNYAPEGSWRYGENRMFSRWIVIALAFLTAQLGASAQAMTSSFDAPVTSVNALFITPPAVSPPLAPFFLGGSIAALTDADVNTSATFTPINTGLGVFSVGAVVTFAADITNNSASFNITATPGGSTLSVAFAQFTGTAFTGVSNTVSAIVDETGLLTISGGSFAAACDSFGGCNSLIFIAPAGTPGGIGVGFVSSAPEPAVWALMIVGFLGVAWRMKAMRASALKERKRARPQRAPGGTIMRPVYSSVY